MVDGPVDRRDGFGIRDDVGQRPVEIGKDSDAFRGNGYSGDNGREPGCR